MIILRQSTAKNPRGSTVRYECPRASRPDDRITVSSAVDVASRPGGSCTAADEDPDGRAPGEEHLCLAQA